MTYPTVSDAEDAGRRLWAVKRAGKLLLVKDRLGRYALRPGTTKAGDVTLRYWERKEANVHWNFGR